MFCTRRDRAVVLLFFISPLAFAQPAKSTPKKPVTVSRLMHITFGSPSWNKDPKAVDTAYIIFRDKTSGRIAQIQLEETEPDSSQFSGRFNVSLNESEKVSPEIYVAPSEIRGADKDNKKLYEAISGGKLPRKPIVWKKNERGQTVLDVYDTRDQAEAAYRVYQEEQKLMAISKGKRPGKAGLADSAMLTARQIELNTKLDNLAKETAKQEAERIRMQQIEQAKADVRAAKLSAMPENERAAIKAKAAALAKEGTAFYSQGQFPEAEAKLRESLDLDPTVGAVQYNYGVTLYRTQKFNESLVALRMAKLDAATAVERDYYAGLVHYRLAELNPAMKLFTSVGNSSNPTLAPSAIFYQGMIHFTAEKYELAKKSFEQVIDVSQDPKMDDQAEEYIERIAAAMAYQKMLEKKWTLSGTIGLMYDSNVLLSPDSASDQGSATDVADVRLLTVADVEYRAILTDKHEASAKATATLINSAQEEAAKADPFLYTFQIPYSYKTTLGSKGYKLSVKPGYEILYMAPSGGTKVVQQSSPFLTVENTLVMKPNWFSMYNLEYRSDDTPTADSVGPNDSDANKISLKTTQILILDKSKKQMLLPALGYTINAAKGDNKKYNRIDLGVTYLRPAFWETSWNVGLALYKVNYSSASPSRDDLNTTLSTGLSKPIRDWVTWSLIGSYSKNDSNVDANEYSKYTVMTTATFVTNF